MNKLKIKKISLALVSVGLLMAGTYGSAQATALATSTLEMTNFMILHSNGTTYDLGDFSVITPSSSANIASNYNGVTGTNFGGLLGGGPTPTGQIDLYPVCQGPGCNQNSNPAHGSNFNGVLDNAFPKLNNPTNPSGSNFVAADQFEAGSPITGQVDALRNPIAAGATIKSGSWASLTSASAGPNNASATNQLSVGWIFTPSQADSLTFNFNTDIYQESFLSADMLFPAAASTSSQFFIKITNDQGVEVFNFSSSSLNTGTSRNAPLDGTRRLAGESAGVPISAAWSLTTIKLDPGREYSLDATLKTTAAATASVPEPDVLALLGIGLLGLGASQFRRRRTAV